MLSTRSYFVSKSVIDCYHAGSNQHRAHAEDPVLPSA